MKRGTPQHPKVSDLMASLTLKQANLCSEESKCTPDGLSLSIPRYVAVGLLESLWHFTARNAPTGAIGKWSNKAIARGIDWQGKPHVLINALLKTSWLRRSKVHRLVVHDWHMHADQTTKRYLASNHLAFASLPLANDSLPEPEPEPEPEPAPRGASAISSLDKIGVAYREVFTHDLPATWTAAIKREATQGDPEVLALIDAKAIRAGMALAAESKGTFGLGWVVRHLHNKAATTAGAAKTKKQQAEAKAEAEAHEAKTDADIKADLVKRRAHFQTLPTDQQEHYRTEAAKGGLVKRPDLIEAMAAMLAWNEKEPDAS